MCFHCCLEADQGHADAQYNLAFCYATGTGTGKNVKEGVRLYRLAANQGHAHARCNLGVCCAHGPGVDKDER